MSGETEVQVSAWTTDTLNKHLIALLAEQSLRFEQRFKAQEVALATALESHDKYLALARETASLEIKEVDARHKQAIEAQQTAVGKAEVAAEKRFDSVNEFRSQLSDQAATFVSRELADAKWSELAQRIEANGNAINELRQALARTAGTAAGSSLTIGWLFAGLAALGGVIGTLVLLANFASTK